MNSLKSISIFCIIALSLLASFCEAGNSTNSTDYDGEITTEPPDEIDKAIDELVNVQCMYQVGDCTMILKMKKPHVKEEKRLAICLKRARGFVICSSMTEDQAKQAQGEAEERLQKAKEEAEEKAQKAKEEAEARQRKREEDAEKRAQEAEARAKKKAAAAEEKEINDEVEP